MKFDKFIKKSFLLIEQDENIPDESLKDAAKTIDKSKAQLTNQVESSQERLIELIKGLVDVLMTEYRAENIKLTPNLTKTLQEIKNSSLIPQPIESLSQIDSIISNLKSEYEKPVAGI